MLLTGRRQEIIFTHLEKGHKYRFNPDIKKVNWRICVKNIKSGQLILCFYNIISKRKNLILNNLINLQSYQLGVFNTCVISLTKIPCNIFHMNRRLHGERN